MHVDLRVLRSDGGLASVALASQYPYVCLSVPILNYRPHEASSVNLLMSGPAGGVSGAATLIAGRTPYKNLLTIDVGGTSTDVCLIVRSSYPHLRSDPLLPTVT